MTAAFVIGATGGLGRAPPAGRLWRVGEGGGGEGAVPRARSAGRMRAAGRGVEF